MAWPDFLQAIVLCEPFLAFASLYGTVVEALSDIFSPFFPCLESREEQQALV
jgi:hypothetical protein